MKNVAYGKDFVTLHHFMKFCPHISSIGYMKWNPTENEGTNGSSCSLLGCVTSHLAFFTICRILSSLCSSRLISNHLITSIRSKRRETSISLFWYSNHLFITLLLQMVVAQTNTANHTCRFACLKSNILNCRLDYLVASYLQTLHDYKQREAPRQAHADGAWVVKVEKYVIYSKHSVSKIQFIVTSRIDLLTLKGKFLLPYRRSCKILQLGA